MSLLQRVQNDKASALALYVVTCEALVATGIEPGPNISETCLALGIARQQVYEEKRRIEAALTAATIAGRGRPGRQGAVRDPGEVPLAGSHVERDLRIEVLEFRLSNPGAVVIHGTGRATYSDGFKRFILDAADVFLGTDEAFCRAASVPYSTLMTWRQLDAKEPIIPLPNRERPAFWPTGATPNELAHTIASDFERWTGKVGDFLSDTAKRLSVAPGAIKNVLRIAGMLAVDAAKPPRYRGTTVNASPGAIVVTDGKEVKVELTTSCEVETFNWQGIVDQATACHLAVVVSKTEDAKAVGEAYARACVFLSRPPTALVHDQKPIHDDAGLRSMIEKSTAMIPATLGRGQNKAVIEGEFGKWAREFGHIQLDDTNKMTLIKSAVSEVIRAYTSGINHAARKELDGKSRAEVVREACPDPKKDAELVAALKASHQRGPHPAKPLPTTPIAQDLLNEAFERLSLVNIDPIGRLRRWLAETFEPTAIQRAIAIFEAKREKGSLSGKTAHRYLVKLIREMQVEIDLEREECALLHYAETERRSWLAALIAAKHEIDRCSTNVEQRLIAYADQALFGSIFIEKAYWEQELMVALAAAPLLLGKITTHIRRLYEATPLCRRRLLNRLVTAHHGIGAPLN
jgi:hypothetical protein